jgi:polygalacturonase
MSGAMCIRGQDYPVSLFGIKSDGSTLNTRSIQFAIDYINSQGGGRLVFSVGRYLTGSIHLKSNVTLRIEEGAVLLGSLNPFDYDREIYTALISGTNEHHIGITGKGVIDGQGRQVALDILTLIHSGIVKDPLVHDRPNEAIRPMLINFLSCENVTIKNITLKNAASWVETYNQCKAVQIDSIVVDSKAYWNNDGVDLVDCDSVQVTNSYIDAADDGICLKSHDDKKVCQHIWVMHNTIRSSASAIKFGTASYGGFRHVRIIDNRVFDTYRSALALEAVDGGFIEDVEIDSLNASHTGNALFLRIGQRVGKRKSRLQNVTINNLSAEIAANKPDSGYEYEGPIEDQPRNISPIVITGLPDAFIENISLRNVSVHFPGAGNAEYAKTLLSELDNIPELPTKYPEFSMFGELPAWGLYIRHARNIICTNLLLSCAKKDYRTAIVLDDVHDSNFSPVTLYEPDNKKGLFLYRSSAVTSKYEVLPKSGKIP